MVILNDLNSLDSKRGLRWERQTQSWTITLIVINSVYFHCFHRDAQLKLMPLILCPIYVSGLHKNYITLNFTLMYTQYISNMGLLN